MACPVRRYPLKQPEKWKPPVPRWQLILPDGVSSVQTLYVGVQNHDSSAPAAFDDAVLAVEKWLLDLKRPDQDLAPGVVDQFCVETGHDLPYTRVWACYWTDQAIFDRATAHLKLLDLHQSFGNDGSSIGLWTESFVTPLCRLETNYAGLHEFPGLAGLPNTKREEHNLSAYWGAARDRLPESANDLFEMPGTTTQSTHNDTLHPYETLPNTTSDAAVQPPSPPPRGIGQHLIGTNYDNVVHIRSGQCWNQCASDEAHAYESNLQQSLMKGMEYLWSNPVYTGTLGLRWLRNIGSSSSPSTPKTTNSPLQYPDNAVMKPINETSGAGFFRNLRDLEVWSSSHPTHKAIFAGAHAHARKWGKERKFMTWHEVSVLKAGEARWEYVNCDPGTGVVRWVEMESVKEL
jgi:Haem-containing dehydratase